MYFLFHIDLKKNSEIEIYPLAIFYHSPLLKAIINILLDFLFLVPVLVLNFKSNLPI